MVRKHFWCVAGRLFTWAQRPTVAVRLFRTAVRLDPQHIAARHELASSLWWTGRYEEAIREYRIVADARPEDAGVLYQFGYVLRMHGLYEEALDVLTRALALETRSEIHIEIARCYSGMGRVDDAERAIERALRYAPDDLDALSERVKIAGEGRRWETAVDLGLRLMSLKPSAMTAYVTAVGLDRLGRSGEAEELLNQAIVLEPDNVDILAELAMVLVNQDKHEEATATLARAARLQPTDYNVSVAASRLALRQGNAQAALEHARDAVGKNPDLPETHYALASAYLELDRLQEALDAFRRTHELAPGVPEAHAGIAVVQCELGNYADSLNTFEELGTAHPDYLSRPWVRPYYDRARSGSE